MWLVKDSPIMYEGIEVNIEVTFEIYFTQKSPNSAFPVKMGFWSLYHNSAVIEHREKKSPCFGQYWNCSTSWIP